MAGLKTRPTKKSVNAFLAGFAPRKQNPAIYCISGLAGPAPLLRRLGRHTSGACCLDVKRLDDVDLDVLARIVRESVARARRPRA